jgi:hypothetical protein
MLLSRKDTWLVGGTPFKLYKNPARSSFLVGQLPSSRLPGSLLSIGGSQVVAGKWRAPLDEIHFTARIGYQRRTALVRGTR